VAKGHFDAHRYAQDDVWKAIKKAYPASRPFIQQMFACIGAYSGTTHQDDGTYDAYIVGPPRDLQDRYELTGKYAGKWFVKFRLAEAQEGEARVFILSMHEERKPVYFRQQGTGRMLRKR
jgi:hypothetical protein